MKFLCLLKILFIKLLVSSIFKEKKIQDDKSKIRSLSIGSAVHNPYITEDLLTIGPFIRGKIRGVLHKTRLIFPRINGPNIWFDLSVYSNNPNPNPNPYFVYEPLICQRPK